MSTRKSTRKAFSLVELLIVLLVLGVILYFAFPNIVQVKSDSERELAKARAETLNMAAAAHVQARGTNFIATNWPSRSDDQKYMDIAGYIAFPATNLSSFLPSTDYSIQFDTNEPHKKKAKLFGPGGIEIAY